MTAIRKCLEFHGYQYCLIARGFYPPGLEPLWKKVIGDDPCDIDVQYLSMLLFSGELNVPGMIRDSDVFNEEKMAKIEEMTKDWLRDIYAAN